MAWRLEYDDTLRAIHVKLFGNITGAELHSLTSAAIARLKKEGVLDVLVDATELESAPPIIDIYNLPAEQYVEEQLNRTVRIAMIMPKSRAAEEAARFYETTCINRGWSVRSFPGRERATEWLQHGDSSSAPITGDAV